MKQKITFALEGVKTIRICMNTEWIMEYVMNDYAVDDGGHTNELIATKLIEELVARLESEDTELVTRSTSFHEWNGLYGPLGPNFRKCGAIATFDERFDAESWESVEREYFKAVEATEKEVESWEKEQQ